MLPKEMMPDSSWKLIGIPISLWQLERNPGSPASPQEASLLPSQASRRTLKFSSQLERSPDVAEPTRVLKGHPCCSSRTYNRIPLQLKTNHETSTLRWDEVWFPCIACRAISCCPSNTKGAFTSFVELRRVPKNTVTLLGRPCGHSSYM